MLETSRYEYIKCHTPFGDEETLNEYLYNNVTLLYFRQRH